MNISELILTNLQKAGSDLCFANLGTTEMPFIEAFEKTEKIKAVLCLFEGVATGAADGFARMSEKIGLSLLHLGPGYANGIANLHNARRAKSPVINLIGDHAKRHRKADAPLSMPLKALVEALPGYFIDIDSEDDLKEKLKKAMQLASSGKIVNLVLPHDVQTMKIDEKLTGEDIFFKEDLEREDLADLKKIEEIARELKKARKAAIILGGKSLSREGIERASAISAKIGAKLFMETFPARVERGFDLPNPERIAYFPEMAIESLKDFDTILLVDTKEPVAFFAYPGLSGKLLNQNQKLLSLMDKDFNSKKDCLLNLKLLKENLKASIEDRIIDPSPLKDLQIGNKLDILSLGQVLASLQPENAIVVDEGISSSFFYNFYASGAAPHTALSLTGGAIGFGLPCATGASMACPQRPVISLQADGSALYTIQALWTQAREKLPITTILCENQGYNIIDMEMLRAGIKNDTSIAKNLTRLSDPAIDWLKLAEGFGIDAREINSVKELYDALDKRDFMDGPCLFVVRLK